MQTSWKLICGLFIYKHLEVRIIVLLQTPHSETATETA